MLATYLIIIGAIFCLGMAAFIHEGKSTKAVVFCFVLSASALAAAFLCAVFELIGMGAA